MNTSTSNETEPLNDVRNRHEEHKKPPTRKIRSESPPPLRPFRHKPYKTIFLVLISSYITSLDLLFTVLWNTICDCRMGANIRKGNRGDLSILLVRNITYNNLNDLVLIPGIYHGVIIVCIWIGV